LKILFSPSEAKYRGGTKSIEIDSRNYLFPELFDKRVDIIREYKEYIKKASHDELTKLFGSKKVEVVDYYSDNIFERDTMKVVERYSGVAYGYLDYRSLDEESKKYIDQNTIIFSNLFGPLLAGDMGLPDYKLKQGEKIGDISPEKHYREYFADALDAMLGSEPYLDLRAGFYNKFYKPSSPYTTLKFIKNGKVVSHWAKAYRGIVMREIAKANINNLKEFMNLEIENLSVVEIIERGIHSEIIYDIR